MHAENFDLQRYFERIAYAGAPQPDLACTTEIMRCHLRTVPFENLDVLAGRGISLAPQDIVEKIIDRRRGGYCYEVNGLFAMALSALGVSWRFVGCRPMTYPARRPRTHMAILATFASEEWLFDVGFGSYGIRAPMRLNDAGEVRQDFDTFQLFQPNEREYQLRAWVNDGWADQYCFDLSHHEWVDFLPANWLNSTHPDTIFMKHLIVMKQTPEGREILFGDRLKTVVRHQTEVRQVAANELTSVLWEYFDLRNVL
jgi:N-hydroxyarylamine O-acetyltransferase